MDVVELVEKLLDVEFDHPAAPHRHQHLPQLVERLVRRTSRPKAVRARQEVLLVDRLEHHRHRPLQHLVLESGDPDRAHRLAVALRDLHPAHRRRLVAAGLEALQQRAEVGLESLGVLGRSLPVDAHGPVLARPTVRLAQKLEVDVMGQRGQHPLRVSPRQLCYPLESRGDDFGPLGVHRLALLRFHVPAALSLHGVPRVGSPASQVQ